MHARLGVYAAHGVEHGVHVRVLGQLYREGLDPRGGAGLFGRALVGAALLLRADAEYDQRGRDAALAQLPAADGEARGQRLGRGAP